MFFFEALMHQQRQQRVTPAAKDRPTTDWIPYTENKLGNIQLLN